MPKMKAWIKVGRKRNWLKYLLRGLGTAIAGIVVGIPVWIIYMIATMLLGVIPIVGLWIAAGMTILSLPFALILNGWIVTKITEIIQ